MLVLCPLDVACIVKVSNCKAFDHKRIKILAPKQILQRLTIALAQVKAGNTSENFINKIRQIIYSLCQEKKLLKKCITI